ncbi:PREDICTED: collagen alpha-1(III) chain-like [Lipotes vexillifer]|uniref:Collagen alpha-1(III) chain-like n=1 Tax=Lipotes vexillifer TaxID=118797 RepID=A0A340XY25_LIPVE|nr:PREDICTED: collagen alpha-1(III) chain-like [Lipotes vexillifer]
MSGYKGGKSPRPPAAPGGYPQGCCLQGGLAPALKDEASERGGGGSLVCPRPSRFRPQPLPPGLPRSPAPARPVTSGKWEARRLQPGHRPARPGVPAPVPAPRAPTPSPPPRLPPPQSPPPRPGPSLGFSASYRGLQRSGVTGPPQGPSRQPQSRRRPPGRTRKRVGPSEDTTRAVRTTLARSAARQAQTLTSYPGPTGSRREAPGGPAPSPPAVRGPAAPPGGRGDRTRLQGQRRVGVGAAAGRGGSGDSLDPGAGSCFSPRLLAQRRWIPTGRHGRRNGGWPSPAAVGQGQGLREGTADFPQGAGQGGWTPSPANALGTHREEGPGPTLMKLKAYTSTDPASPRCAGRRAQVDARALRGDQRRAHPNTPAPPPAPWIGSPQACRARIGSRGAAAGPVSRWVAPQRGCCSVPPRPPGAWSPSGRAGPGGDTAGSRSAAHPVPSAKGSPGPRPHPGAAGGGQRAMQGRGTRRGARWSGGPRRRR